MKIISKTPRGDPQLLARRAGSVGALGLGGPSVRAGVLGNTRAAGISGNGVRLAEGGVRVIKCRPRRAEGIALVKGIVSFMNKPLASHQAILRAV